MQDPNGLGLGKWYDLFQIQHNAINLPVLCIDITMELAMEFPLIFVETFCGSPKDPRNL